MITMKCRAVRRKKLSFKILDVSRDDISSADTDTASSSDRRPLSTSGARKHSLSSPRRKGVRFTEQVSPSPIHETTLEFASILICCLIVYSSVY
jgi:hypothetical protein